LRSFIPEGPVPAEPKMHGALSVPEKALSEVGLLLIGIWLEQIVPHRLDMEMILDI